MEKIFIALFAVLIMGCDAENRSSEQGPGSELEESAPLEPTESDDAIHSDTTMSGGMNRQNQYDTLK